MEKLLLNRIKAVLADLGLTQKDLFNRLSVRKKITYNTVASWCRNDSQPDLLTLRMIADVLNVSIRVLIVDTVVK